MNTMEKKLLKQQEVVGDFNPDNPLNPYFGAPIVDNNYYPGYHKVGTPYDVSDPGYYLVTIDTFSEHWYLCYFETDGTVIDRLNMPLSGSTGKITFNEDGTFDIDLKEDGKDWKLWWGWVGWEFEKCKLQDGDFVAHIDMETREGWMAPKEFFKKPKKDK